MSSFKSFKIWMGWFRHKYFGLSCSLAFLSLICGVFGFMFFAGLALFGITDNLPVPPNLMLGIVFLIGGIGLYSFLTFGPGSCNYSSENWRIAIEDALKFLKTCPLCKAKIEDFIRHTKETKNGSEMNEWIKNHERLLAIKEELQKLGNEQKKILPKIEERKEEIRDLETKLGHY